MGTKTLLSVEEYVNLPDDEGVQHELHEGEVVEMASPKHRHTVIALRIYDGVRDYLKTNPLGSVFHEAGAKLTEREPRQTVLQPDVSYYRKAKIDIIPPDGYAGIPDLAVEVISPSEYAALVNRKKNYYLRALVESLWLIFDESREVHVLREGKLTRLTAPSGVLADPVLFPGWQGIALEDLFE
jgi:Uma2 family endonuclease